MDREEGGGVGGTKVYDVIFNCSLIAYLRVPLISPLHASRTDFDTIAEKIYFTEIASKQIKRELQTQIGTKSSTEG